MNIADVILCLRMTVALPIDVGDITYDPPAYSAHLITTADANLDGVVDIRDLMLILIRSLH